MSGRDLSRRDFIRLASLGLVGGYAALKTGPAQAMGGGGMGGGGGCGGGGCGGGGGSLIDPPIGAALKDPSLMPLSNPAPGVVECSVEARQAAVNVNGVSAQLLTYNGSYPGPMIKLRKGDKLRINFRNSLPGGSTNLLGKERGMTSLHTHGWHVSPTTMDNVMRMFMPGECSDDRPFEYDLSKQEAGTLCWYHPHTHMLTAEQLWAGLQGPLLVEDDVTTLSGFKQNVLVLKDITISGGLPAPYTSQMEYMHGKEGDTCLVNGLVNPLLTVQPGEVRRLRILNASNARFYKLQLASHTLQVVGTDGGLLDKPYAQSYVLMSPGERLDVLVKASTTKGYYKLSAMPYSRMGMMSSAQVTLMTVQVAGNALSQALPTSVNPAAKRVAVDTSMVPKRTFTLSMSMGMGATRGYINGQDFDVSPYTISSSVMKDMAMYELWTIDNSSTMDHPWHQHVNAAQVVSITGGDAAYRTLYTSSPAWKDVVIVPAGGSVTQLVRIADYDGMAMFHCHILEHEDIGMMGIWNIGMSM
jgi:FtsP/CotA-like multicopper oxidase with cupredoxin domain